jgi:hypothetical protein
MRFGLAVLAAVLLAGCDQKPKESVVVDPALLVLAPSDSVVLAGVRVDKLKDTPLYAKYVEPNQPKQLDEFVRITGIDPRKHLQEFLVAVTKKEPVLLVRGKFSKAPLAAIGGDRPELRLVQQGWKEETMQGLQVATNGDAVVGFINPSVAVVGTRAAVSHTLSERGKGGPSKPMQDAIRRIGYRHQVWAVSNGAPMQSLETADLSVFAFKLVGLGEAIRGIKEVRAGADFSKGAYVEIEADAANADQARNLHDAMRGGLGFARLQTPSDKPELLGMLDKVKVSMDAARISIRADFAPEQIEEVSRMVNALNRRGGGE